LTPPPKRDHGKRSAAAIPFAYAAQTCLQAEYAIYAILFWPQKRIMKGWRPPPKLVFYLCYFVSQGIKKHYSVANSGTKWSFSLFPNLVDDSLNHPVFHFFVLHLICGLYIHPDSHIGELVTLQVMAPHWRSRTSDHYRIPHYRIIALSHYRCSIVSRISNASHIPTCANLSQLAGFHAVSRERHICERVTSYVSSTFPHQLKTKDKSIKIKVII